MMELISDFGFSISDLCTPFVRYLESKRRILIYKNLQPGVIIISLLGPVIMRAMVAERDGAYAFQVFDAIFYRDNQAQRQAMFKG
jgi:hypothetical protein